MPAFYAHKRFGAMVAKELPECVRKVIHSNEALFELGLQGPDFLFYYQPWHKNRVAAYGVRMHETPGHVFFRQAKRVLSDSSSRSAAFQTAADETEFLDCFNAYGQRAYAYLIGFLCHFVLDSACHPYVNAMMKPTGAGHLEIEGEFEKFLLRMDGQNPLSWPVAAHIADDAQTAQTVSLFYKKITFRETEDALRDFKHYKRLLTAPFAWKQHLINLLLHIGGKYQIYKGLMLQPKDNPHCEETNQTLWKQMQDAVGAAVELAHELDVSVWKGAPLSARFDYDFEGIEHKAYGEEA